MVTKILKENIELNLLDGKYWNHPKSHFLMIWENRSFYFTPDDGDSTVLYSFNSWILLEHADPEWSS